MHICAISSMKYLKKPMHSPHAYSTIQHEYASTTYNQIKDKNYKTIPYVEPDIRVLLTQPNNQDIPYLDTKPTIPGIP
jgi:hypothetical protein